MDPQTWWLFTWYVKPDKTLGTRMVASTQRTRSAHDTNLPWSIFSDVLTGSYVLQLHGKIQSHVWVQSRVVKHSDSSDAQPASPCLGTGSWLCYSVCVSGVVLMKFVGTLRYILVQCIGFSFNKKTNHCELHYTYFTVNTIELQKKLYLTQLYIIAIMFICIGWLSVHVQFSPAFS